MPLAYKVHRAYEDKLGYLLSEAQLNHICTRLTMGKKVKFAGLSLKLKGRKLYSWKI